MLGAWCEGSKDLHWLLDVLADTKVNSLARGLGAEGWERDKILSRGSRREESRKGGLTGEHMYRGGILTGVNLCARAGV